MGDGRQQAVKRRRAWRLAAGLAMWATIAWVAWQCRPAKPLLVPGAPANAAMILDLVRDCILAGYEGADEDDSPQMLGSLAVSATLHEQYPASTRHWLLRHLLLPGRPTEPGISDYELCFLASFLVTGEAERQAVITDIVLPYCGAPATPWRRRTTVLLGLHLRCRDPAFLRMALETCNETQATEKALKRPYRFFYKYYQRLQRVVMSMLPGNWTMPELFQGTRDAIWRLRNWLDLASPQLPADSIASNPDEFLLQWSRRNRDHFNSWHMLRALQLSPADQQVVAASDPEIAAYLAPREPSTREAPSTSQGIERGEYLVSELQAMRPRILTQWSQASSAEAALELLPALMVMDNAAEPWLTAFLRRWPDYYATVLPDNFSPQAAAEARREREKQGRETPADIVALMTEQQAVPSDYAIGFYSQHFLAEFWQNEAALLARAPAWRRLAHAWRTNAGEAWPAEHLTTLWDEARERLHAEPDLAAARYASVILAAAWAETDPRAAERRFRPFWPDYFGGPSHLWCAAAVAADLLPADYDDGEPWIYLWRISQGRPGLATALVVEELMDFMWLIDRQFRDFRPSEWRRTFELLLTHPALYSDQESLDMRRYLATQGWRHAFVPNSLAYYRGHHDGEWDSSVFDMHRASEWGLQADQPVRPQPFYMIFTR